MGGHMSASKNEHTVSGAREMQQPVGCVMIQATRPTLSTPASGDGELLGFAGCHESLEESLERLNRKYHRRD
jgi:hypothetical protein